jgi:hypothetical protein
MPGSSTTSVRRPSSQISSLGSIFVLLPGLRLNVQRNSFPIEGSNNIPYTFLAPLLKPHVWFLRNLDFTTLTILLYIIIHYQYKSLISPLRKVLTVIYLCTFR